MVRLVVLFALLLVAIPSASAQATPLGGRIADLVRQANLGEGVGVLVSEGGRDVFGLQPDVVRNPASNQKLVTAAAALLVLGPDFTMRTALYGRVESGRITDLVLRGYGDPGLEHADLWSLADDLADRGVRAVDRVWVDGSYFDDQILPPAFEQQPGEMAAFRAAVGAVSVDQASFVLRVLPGPSVGAPTAVRLAASGYFEVDNGMTTTAEGAPNVIASQRALDDGRLQLILRGTMPASLLGVGYRRRIEHPLMHAGHTLLDALDRVGIRGARRVAVGPGPDGLALLASHESAPLAQLLHPVGKQSDNFYAEMILKVLGAERARPGTSARGVEVCQEVLERAGVPRGAATQVNGSGLFDGNLIAPRHLVKLLEYVYQQPGVRAEYLAHLAIGGADGTLSRRLRDLPRAGIVRAKTGTLNDAISLSGYVLGPPGEGGRERVVTFSFLANGIRGRQGAARQLADEIVRAVASDLYR
ncbi:MAG: D-alanyl-D-alanine carboxypeptidase/D-alanyl-D-alanine-endopeptidase [Myxococcales bacterium]|nr:D-alanyl-D-alanine carboxypeptidase/D-alanyl-D-alanine-endopeptidase [Myxococcales bacterium]